MRQEWRILKADRTAQTIIGLFIILTGCGVFNGFSGISAQHQAAAESRIEQNETYDKARQQFEKIESEKIAKSEPLNRFKTYEESPWSVQLALNDFTAVLPPGSLAAVATGRNGIEPQTYSYKKYTDDSPTQPTVGAKSLGGVFPERVTRNPLKNFVGRFDLAFVMLYIYPLLILALSFNLIAAEREAGTLQMALAQPIHLNTLVLGKTFLRAALVFISGVLLPGIAVSLGHFYLTGNASVPRLLLWFVAVAGYGLFWFSLALLVNAIGKSAKGNALILAVFWMAFVVLIPAGASLIAQTLFPIPSRIRFADTERAARLAGNADFYRTFELFDAEFKLLHPRIEGDAANAKQRERARMKEQIRIPPDETMLTNFFARYPDFPAQGLTLNQFSYAMYPAREDYIETRLAPILSRMNEQRASQQATVNALGFLSPAMLLQQILEEIAGTGKARHEHFLGQFDAYIRERNAIFYPKMMNGETVLASEFDSIPRFIYREEFLRDVLMRISIFLLILLTLPLAVGCVGLRAYKNYPVIG